MPRINVEEKWWSDPRRGRLSDKLGRRAADGLMLEAWRLSQEFCGEFFEWKPYFEKQEIEALESSFLAEIKGDLIYIKGSKEHHLWILNKRKAASRGGKALRNKINNLQKASLKHQQSNTKPSSSSSYSNYVVSNKLLTSEVSKSNAVQNSLEKPDKSLAVLDKPELAPKKITLFVKAYFKAYESRYGCKPLLTKKDFGRLSNALKTISPDKIEPLAQVYLQLDDKWFATKSHDVETFLQNMNKINTSLQTGKNTKEFDNIALDKKLDRVLNSIEVEKY